jgi:hypothetical protein
MVPFYGEYLLASRPTPKLEDHPLSAVRDSLCDIFAATLHIGGLPDFKRTGWAAFPAHFEDRISDPLTIPDEVAVNKSVNELTWAFRVSAPSFHRSTIPFPFVFRIKYAGSG